MLKLTRKQELALIDLGLQKVIDSLTVSKPKSAPRETPKPKTRRWTTAQRKKFQKSMKKKWAEKRAAEK